ncbi:alpha/beta hydrolase [Chryseobacterium sp.]|uniref:alpha/beta hydrolase n=1 Tax=Chryseobacterium sp. TaxID=1871047 RepID=UPI0025C705A6|nr:alpha/beta hydrolase [Chryseobacterium sp.]MBV8326265.1 alpha/beta hydrolase [Chryseobacterium sp.]
MKKGTYQLHTDSNFNFQLNRTIMWGGGDWEEIKSIAPKISTTEDWVREMTFLGTNAENHQQISKAIGYYRMAEFFEADGSPEKSRLYLHSKSLFYHYHKSVFDQIIQRDKVAYEDKELPVWIARPQGEIKDTVVIHGGNDSYMEEFLPVVQWLLSMEIAVYIFDGPGQGGALRESGIYYTYEWEKPVTTILNAYQLDEVTLIGLSLGGMLAPRAAAFEDRIKRVVAWGIMPNFYDVILTKIPEGLRVLMEAEEKQQINALIEKKMKIDPLVRWAIQHGMFSMNVDTPYDYLKKTRNFEMESIGSQITQDFLLLGSNEDHFIPVEFYKRVIDALPNVKSLTYKMYTKNDSAENHCSFGNTELVLKDIVHWILNAKNK